MFAELYQITSYIVFKVISGILGALAEFKVLRAFAEFAFLGALIEFKVWGVFVSDLGFKSFESCPN